MHVLCLTISTYVSYNVLLNRMGPLVRHWTVRFEAKHQYLESLTSRMGNFVNICFSLAVRQQSYLCYSLSCNSGMCVEQQIKCWKRYAYMDTLLY